MQEIFQNFFEKILTFFIITKTEVKQNGNVKKTSVQIKIYGIIGLNKFNQTEGNLCSYVTMQLLILGK